LAQFLLDHATAVSVGRRAHVAVTMTLDDRERRSEAHTSDGRPMPAATVAAWLCDAHVHRFVRDGASMVVDVGRSTRTVSPRLFDAVAPARWGLSVPRL
jgi:hypothetical protein